MRRVIRERGRSKVGGLAFAALTVAVLAIPSSAAASFHLTKITEVYTGTGITGTTDDYVELQAFQAGQNLVTGHTITFYDDEGVQIGTPFTFPSSVPNAQTQRTILVAAGPLANGVTSDFTDASIGDKLLKGGGAVCFDSQPVDCVAWGTFTGASLPGAVGTPVAPTGIPNGSSITRSIAAGCATLLEASDDTDNSATDFAVTTDRTPRPNTETPTEKACGGGGGGGDSPNTTIEKGPKKKTSKTSAKFKFSSSENGADFECSLDGKKFKSCSSPFKAKKLKKGKHTFEVKAIAGGAEDETPAEYRWKVVEK